MPHEMHAPGRLTPRVALSIALLCACSGSSGTLTGGPARITETFLFINTVLQPNGSMAYPVGTSVPSVTVNGGGLVQATVQFQGVSGCEFVFSFDLTAGTTQTNVAQIRGAGPTLIISATMAAGTYQVSLTARSGGVSLCGTLPAQGVPMPFTIQVVHP